MFIWWREVMQTFFFRGHNTGNILIVAVTIFTVRREYYVLSANWYFPPKKHHEKIPLLSSTHALDFTILSRFLFFSIWDVDYCPAPQPPDPCRPLINAAQCAFSLATTFLFPYLDASLGTKVPPHRAIRLWLIWILICPHPTLSHWVWISSFPPFAFAVNPKLSNLYHFLTIFCSHSCARLLFVNNETVNKYTPS